MNENLDKYAMPHVIIGDHDYCLDEDTVFDGGCLSCALNEKCRKREIPEWCRKICKNPELFGTDYEMCWLDCGKAARR